MIWRYDAAPQYRELRGEIDAAVARVLASGRYILGEELRQFEEEFASYLGAAEVIGVANGTDALTLALQAAGVGPGDEVVTTPFSAVPTLMAILATGARPIFVDICLDTFLMDIEQVPAAITPRTKAVVPVHIFGNPVDIAGLRSLLPDRVTIVEDAAQAHGSTIGARKCGTMGDLAAFSFYPTKNLGGCGDGGAVVTGNADFARTVRLRRNYGMVDKDQSVVAGVNSRLDEIQAAILRCKLRHLDHQNARRRAIAARYREELRGDLFVYQASTAGAAPNYHVFAARAICGRDAMMAHLDKLGIQTNDYYPLPLYRQQSVAHEYRDLHLPNVEQLCREGIALPMYGELDNEKLTRIIAAVNSFGGDRG
jgi:dTDP-4-amino-4,6-dideoxygalactose transaminase